jgi:hypothetical protein
MARLLILPSQQRSRGRQLKSLPHLLMSRPHNCTGHANKSYLPTPSISFSRDTFQESRGENRARTTFCVFFSLRTVGAARKIQNGRRLITREGLLPHAKLIKTKIVTFSGYLMFHDF